MIFNACGQEFVTQLVFVYLAFVCLPKRKAFAVRYILSLLVIVGLGWLLIILTYKYKLQIEPWEYLLFFCLVILATVVSFRVNYMQAIFIGLITYCMQHLISTISYAIFFWFAKSRFDFSYYYIIMPIIQIVSEAFTVFCIARPLSRKRSLEFNNAWVLVSSVIFILVAVFLSYYAGRVAVLSLDMMIYIRLMSALTTVSVMIMLELNVWHTSEKNENKILRILLDTDKKRYLAAKAANEKVQIKYHDILQRKQQRIVDYEELDEIEENKDVLLNTFFTGNRALDIILGEKASECDKNGIKFICVADGGVLDFMKAHHIYSLVNNILENAIESLRTTDNAEAKEIEFTIISKQQLCIIKESNYAERVVFDNGGIPITTKKDKEEHGYGVKSIMSVVDKYDGNIKFSFDNKVFTVMIMIPLPKK